MVKRNQDGTLKVTGQEPDIDWLAQIRAEEEEEGEPDVELEEE